LPAFVAIALSMIAIPDMLQFDENGPNVIALTLKALAPVLSPQVQLCLEYPDAVPGSPTKAALPGLPVESAQSQAAGLLFVEPRLT
jgi:hypothetical protein